jgi:ParB family chromosome partitioning protein
VSRKALGKGLSALIPERAGGENPGVSLLPVDRISPNPYQPRKKISPEALEELVESVKTQGILQPILVRKSATGYEIIAGERRWRAAAQAGLKQIPAVIREADREGSLVMALVENIQRDDLNPMEAAGSYFRLTDEFGKSQEEVARLVGKDRATVTNYLRLLKLPAIVQDDLADGRLSMGHAKALLSLPDSERQIEARERVLAKGMSVREAEALMKKLARAKMSSRPKKAPDTHLSYIQDELKRRLGTKVLLKGKGRGGTIQIQYHSAEDLERILEILLGSG